jgi:hypothetical protein
MSQKKASQFSIDNYFEHNNISPKTTKQATKRQIEICNFKGEKYYKSFYNEALDEFLISLDYKGHQNMYVKILKTIGKGKDILEPGCGSGILGCYIANSNNKYQGIETNNFGYEMAKKRAKNNNINPDIFKLNEFFNYTNQHEILLTCKFLGGNKLKIDSKKIEKARQISSQIIGIEQIDFYDNEQSKLAQYKNEFNKQGLKFEVSYKPVMSNGNNTKYFLFKAKE